MQRVLSQEKLKAEKVKAFKEVILFRESAIEGKWDHEDD
jgi:hypothetical protein